MIWEKLAGHKTSPWEHRLDGKVSFYARNRTNDDPDLALPYFTLQFTPALAEAICLIGNKSVRKATAGVGFSKYTLETLN